MQLVINLVKYDYGVVYISSIFYLLQNIKIVYTDT